MEPPQLKSGETVIPLAGLVVLVAMISGLINSAVVAWKTNQVWWLGLLIFTPFLIVCFFTSKKIGLLIFPAPSEDQVRVVKAGRSALPYTLTAALAGSITGAIVLGLIFPYFLGGVSLLSSVWLWVIIFSSIVGVLWGLLSALT